MPDTQEGSRNQVELTQAVAYVEDRPLVELTADEWIYPITTADGRFKLYFHAKPYSSYSVKKFYDQILPRRKARTAQQNVIDADFDSVKKFIDDFFLGLSGVTLEDGKEPTTEQQRSWLDQNPDFKVRAFREGIDRVGLRDEPALDVKGGKTVLIMSRPESTVATDIGLYSKLRKTDEVIRVKHVLNRLSESDRHQYDKAIKFIEDTRQRETFLEANWDVIENLYALRIKSIDGATVQGLPCDESLKADWVKLVPFCWKVFVMSSVYSEIELKNG